MIFIVITAIIVYFVCIAWTWHSLGEIEQKKKVIFIFIGIILIYGITWFICPKSGIDYQKVEMKKQIQNILVLIFTGINAIIVMPQIGKLLEKIKENEIEKEKLKKRIILLIILFILCIFFERGYMKDTQEGILRVYQSIK